MAAKLAKTGPYVAFHCPGCGEDHCVSVQRHTWNGSMDLPTFQPSLLCDRPGVRCHSYITAGKIAFCNDSKHKFAGQTLEIPEWDPQKEKPAMAANKDLKPGDPVRLLAPHVNGIRAVVVLVLTDSIMLGQEGPDPDEIKGGCVGRQDRFLQ